MRKNIIWSAASLFVGVILIIIGGWAFFRLLTEGHVVTNLTSYVPWGIGVSWYVYLVWLEVGTLLAYSLLVYVFGVKELKSIETILYLSGFMILTAAVSTIILDLGRMGRSFNIFFRPHFSSMITWMAWVHVLYSGIIALELFISVFARRGVRLAEYIDKNLGWLPGVVSIAAGTVLISIIGTLFSTVGGREGWQSGSLPLLFLLSSVTVGSGLLSVMYILVSPEKGTDAYRDSVNTLGKTMLIFIIFSIVAGLGVSVTQRISVVQAYFTGAYHAPWAFILGLIIPMIALIVHAVAQLPFIKKMYLVGGAALLMLLSLWVIPLNIILSPQMAEPISGLAEAFPHERLSYRYTPSGTEWALNMLPLGIALIGFTVGYWVLHLYAPLRKAAGKET